MAMFARLNPDDSIAEVRAFDAQPPDILHKDVRWVEYEKLPAPAINSMCYALGALEYVMDGGKITASHAVVPKPIETIRTAYKVRIKKIAERKILAVLPDHKQRNLTALGVESVILYGADPTQWPSQLQQIWAQGKAAWDIIKVIRAASDAKEAAIAAMSFEELESYDFEAGWD